MVSELLLFTAMTENSERNGQNGLLPAVIFSKALKQRIFQNGKRVSSTVKA